MRRLPAMLAALALASLGVLVPATSAQADNWACNDNYEAAMYGYMYAYDDMECHGVLWATPQSWDSDWGNSNGPFRGADTNNASSILNKGSIPCSVLQRHRPGLGRRLRLPFPERALRLEPLGQLLHQRCQAELRHQLSPMGEQGQVFSHELGHLIAHGS
ncbi:hypothetical protein [Streptomyces sp. KL116D]|uniref:hypothetical protein n=1 Tax=Streptomyces sp. KL116D TaxID=3045152 RepID=UPI0035574802